MEIPTTVTALIGLVGAPFLIVMLVEHLVELVAWATPGRMVPKTALRTLVALGFAFLLRGSGGLAEIFAAGLPDTVATVVIVGLALSFVAGQLHDRVPALTAARK